jgi:TusA-related sulfurtransferase
MAETIHADRELDCRGRSCPGPVFMVADEVEKLTPGMILKVLADDPASEEDITRWSKRTGNDLLKMEKSSNMVTFYIRKVK